MLEKIETLLKSIKDKLSEKEVMSVDKNGQWDIEKSGYSGYSKVDNIRRKAGNIEGDKNTGIKTMNRTKGWSGPAKQKMEAKEIKRREKDTKASTKLWTQEHGWHTKDKDGNITPAAS